MVEHAGLSSSLRLWIVLDGNQRPYELTDDARLLLDLWFCNKVPIGVFLDRLQEYPEEVEGVGPEVVAGAVEYLRTQYPYGV